MRTFRFITSEDSQTEAQQQTVECNLYLNPTDDLSRTIQEQAADCACYTVEDCQDNCQSYF